MIRLMTYSLIFILTVFLILVSVFKVMGILINYPHSPYYVDWETPEPIYDTDADIHILNEEQILVSGLEERNIEYQTLNALPSDLVDAFIAIEDNNFYSHNGYDIKGIARAFWVNLLNREFLQGGSTITQQLARNLFLGHDQTIDRKLLEFALARELEKRYNKDQIIEMYINQVYFGNGNWGIEQASRDYFEKSASKLDLGESALIAGLVQAPSFYAPVSSWEPAVNRQNVVLRRMYEQGFITEEEAQEVIYRENINIDEGYSILQESLNCYRLTGIGSQGVQKYS